MERTKLLVSPSLSVPNSYTAGDSSLSHIVADNFSDPSPTTIKSPKPEPVSFNSSSIINQIQDSYLLPLPDQLPPVDLVPVVDYPDKRLRSSSTPSIYSTQLPQKPLPSELARRRRSKISDRIKILESLMPFENKMPMAKTLEEAHKYISFLEAQVTALQTMPLQSAVGVPVWTDRSGRFGGMEMMNRQQMLVVMMNSSAVQNCLYRKECCVFSAEQVEELRRRVVEGQTPPVMLLTGSCSSSC